MAGGDISITFQARSGSPESAESAESKKIRKVFQTRPELVNKAVAVIRGPKAEPPQELPLA